MMTNFKQQTEECCLMLRVKYRWIVKGGGVGVFIFQLRVAVCLLLGGETRSKRMPCLQQQGLPQLVFQLGQELVLELAVSPVLVLELEHRPCSPSWFPATTQFTTLVEGMFTLSTFLTFKPQVW